MAAQPRATSTATARHHRRAVTALQPADRLTPGETPPEWVTLAAGAARLSLCARTLRRAIARGELTAYRFGKAVRVRLADLDAWAESKADPTGRTVEAR